MKILVRLALAALLTQLLHCGMSEVGKVDPASAIDPTTPSAVGDVPKANDAAAPPASPDASAAPSPHDPAKDGPYAVQELDATAHVAETTDDVPIHCAFPVSGPTSGPFPVVVLAHGFQLPASQYYGYVKRLASFGYVALTADYPAGLLSKSNIKDADDLSGALDWALAAPELAGKADATKAGVMGHSRGGKDAVLVAVRDPRFKAVLGLDPVDAKSPLGCDATTECPDASEAAAKLAIPTAFLGETTDATGGILGNSCAPEADNFTTFYAKAGKPSLEVTIVGANHMSFLDDPGSCGITCSACNEATAADADVRDLAYAMTVAFFERYLRGVTAEDAYLTGAQAQSRYVTTGLAKIQSK
jgi:dienelactone hydrolase